MRPRDRCTAQGDIVNIFAELFGIKIGYHGKLVSNLARVRMDSVVETANDNHLRPWMDMLAVRLVVVWLAGVTPSICTFQCGPCACFA